MSATIVRERNQTTLPADVLAQAGIGPKDQVDWTFEDGKIVGRKLEPIKEDVEIITNLSQLKKGKVSNASIREAIKAGRR